MRGGGTPGRTNPEHLCAGMRRSLRSKHMILKEAIIEGIVHHIRKSSQPEGRGWNVGLASDLHSAYESWGRPADLHYWRAATPEDAQAIETYCVHIEGMKGVTDTEYAMEEKVHICLFQTK